MLVDDYLSAIRLSHRPATVRLRSYQLRHFARHIHPRPLLKATRADVVAWMARTPAPETRSSSRSALASFYDWCVLEGHLEVSPVVRVPLVRRRPGVPRPAPDSVVDAGLASLDARTRLMVLIGVKSGLRVGEIARLHTSDFHDIGMRVHGKGGRERLVPVHPVLLAEVARLPRGYLFPSPHPAHRHLTPGHVSKLMSAALGQGWTAHNLRHRLASRGYSATLDLVAVQQVLGHSSPTTTMTYVACPTPAMVAIIEAA